MGVGDVVGGEAGAGGGDVADQADGGGVGEGGVVFEEGVAEATARGRRVSWGLRG